MSYQPSSKAVELVAALCRAEADATRRAHYFPDNLDDLRGGQRIVDERTELLFDYIIELEQGPRHSARAASGGMQAPEVAAIAAPESASCVIQHPTPLRRFAERQSIIGAMSAMLLAHEAEIVTRQCGMNDSAQNAATRIRIAGVAEVVDQLFALIPDTDYESVRLTGMSARAPRISQ